MSNTFVHFLFLWIKVLKIFIYKFPTLLWESLCKASRAQSSQKQRYRYITYHSQWSYRILNTALSGSGLLWQSPPHIWKTHTVKPQLKDNRSFLNSKSTIHKRNVLYLNFFVLWTASYNSLKMHMATCIHWRKTLLYIECFYINISISLWICELLEIYTDKTFGK